MGINFEPIERCKHPQMEQIEVAKKEIGDTVFIVLVNFCPDCLFDNVVVTKTVKKKIEVKDE